MRYVVLSTDKNPDYSFYAPLTCLAWRWFGYTPIMLFVGSWSSERDMLVVNKCVEAEAGVELVQSPVGYRTSTVAQVVRLCAAKLVYTQADYLLTSDVDMWPTGSWIGSGRQDRDVHLYNAFAYQDQEHIQFPMCYVGAAISAWRKIVPGDNFEGALNLCLRAFDEAKKSWALSEIEERTWDFDERHFGRLIADWRSRQQAQPDFRENVQRIARDMSTLGQRRLDRSNWRVPESLGSYADVHLPRPGFGSHWTSVRQVFSMLYSDESWGKQVAWAENYRRRWQAARP